MSIGQDYDYIYKLITIGDSSVGKSNIITRYSDDIFSEAFLPTIGVDFKIKSLMLNGKYNLKLNIWDTAGQDRFKTITATYYKGCHGVILVYDITDANSFNNIENWIKEADKYTSENVVKILIGNKVDKEAERKVTFEEGQELAKSYGINFLETSAKTKINIDEIFTTICNDIYDSLPDQKKPEGTNLANKPRKKKKEGGCC